MPLRLTSCVPVREPGFSASECLELARRLSGTDVMTGEYPPIDEDDIDSCLSRAECDLIVAALRAYAR